MTEEVWLKVTEPAKMLTILGDKASDRELRLFACACCRRIWRLLTDERSKRAVEVGERFADGWATAEERTSAERDALDASGEAWAVVPGVHSPLGRDSNGETLYPVEYHPTVLRAAATQTACPAVDDFENLPRRNYRKAVHEAALCSRSAAGTIILTQPGWARDTKEGRHYSAEEFAQQAILLRDVFGNPFRPVTLDRSWLTPTVTSLAAAIYEERHLPSGLFDNQRMAILADALEDAGCDNADILGHLRNGGEHVRGCWVIDLLLDKK